MRTLLIDLNGEVTLGDKLPQPLPDVMKRLNPLNGWLDLPSDTVTADTFVFRGYVALKDGRRVLAIYEQTS